MSKNNEKLNAYRSALDKVREALSASDDIGITQLKAEDAYGNEDDKGKVDVVLQVGLVVSVPASEVLSASASAGASPKSA